MILDSYIYFENDNHRVRINKNFIYIYDHYHSLHENILITITNLSRRIDLYKIFILFHFISQRNQWSIFSDNTSDKIDDDEKFNDSFFLLKVVLFF